MSDRLVNIFLLFALIFVFIVYGEADVHNRTILAFILATVFALVAFIFNWLTIDGTTAAIIFGTISFGFGGLTGAAVVLTFFITGSVLSKDLIGREGFLEKRFRRNGSQVWANGFWFALWIMVWFLSQVDGFLIAAVASIAMAAADTWATEVGGKRLKGKTRLITTGEKVVPGTDGGISLYGTLAALCGAMLIAVVFGWFHPEASLTSVIIIIVTGFTGCFIDSYLGAGFQYKMYGLPFISIFGYEKLYVSNNLVNWMSAGLASIIGLVLTLITGI